jgi:cyclopropane fatty-acyl-phospholipid synthase-like methyltransferase
MTEKGKTMQTPFWEQSYQEDNITTFGIEPNQTICERWQAFSADGTVLDVGCGEGKNAIFLAQKGFQVDAFDLSEAGIAKLKRLAAKEQVTLNAWVQDLRNFKFVTPYDVITSHGTLHFVTRAEWTAFIHQAKAATRPGGMHIIQIFTNRIPASPDIAPFIRGLAEEGELARLYADWHLLESRAYIFDDQHPGVPKHHHASNKIVAQKSF